MHKIQKFALLSLALNTAFSAYHIGFGIAAHSWWLFTLGFYYLMLAIVRFAILLSKETTFFLQKLTGGMLLVLSLPLAGTVVLAVVRDRGLVLPQVVMIGMAAYSFTKIILAVVNLVKVRHTASSKLVSLRNISFADACVSIFALQRSMLVSFPGLSEADICCFNILTGTAVWLVVLLLGVSLLEEKRTKMIASKLKNTNKKTVHAVKKSYLCIEHAVVAGYKATERFFVGAYQKIEDKFVAACLTRDGETPEEAKTRLKKK